MPILGNLSEFPLPEVLLLIGMRTGRLRLLDVPEFGIMDVDLSNGEVQAMYLGKDTYTESDDMIQKLSAVVQAQGGMFEFRLRPVASVSRSHPLLVNQLVMSLVCYVDELVAQQRALTSPEHQYVLTSPQPEIWIEPELNEFFHQARPFLANGMALLDLASQLHMDYETVHMHLTHLRLLGLLKLVNMSDPVQRNEMEVHETISRKSNEFLRAARAVGEIKKVSGNLPHVKG
jgi:hypothetical protein